MEAATRQGQASQTRDHLRVMATLIWKSSVTSPSQDTPNLWLVMAQLTQNLLLRTSREALLTSDSMTEAHGTIPLVLVFGTDQSKEPRMPPSVPTTTLHTTTIGLQVSSCLSGAIANERSRLAR